MDELLRSNDPVLLSFVGALLDEAEIAHWTADLHMSVLEGSLGVLPRRLMVARDRLEEARRLMAAAGLAGELSAPGRR